MKHLYIGLIALATFTLSSCTDFLDSNPRMDMTDENFYRTIGDAEKAIIGCYDGLQKVWNDGIAMPILGEIASDNAFGGTGVSDNWEYQIVEEFDIQRAPSHQDIFNENWKAYYAAIFRCNMLLSKMEQIDWEGNDKVRTNIEAQARFLRGYMYFDMVRLWGDIPLLTEPSEEIIPTSPAKDVYALIATDLKFAADNMISEPYSTGWAAKNDGRVTSWAAKALLARVFLYYTGYYNQTDLVGVVTKQNVLDGVEDVIANGGYSLLPDFASNWPVPSAWHGVAKYAKKGHSETVFAIKYNTTSNYDGKSDGNHWLIMLGLRNTMFLPYASGWGACTVSPKLWNAYNPKDKRRDASIISIVDEGIKPELKDQREYTGYANKKYTPKSILTEDGKLEDEVVAMGAVNNMLGQHQDYISIRYADVLLMAAELGSAQAQAYFDDVRKRAFKDAFTALTVSKDNILKERQLELAFEGHRYWDLMRQGLDVAASTIAETTKVLNGGVEVTKVIKKENMLKTKGLQQIPYTQINQSQGMLKQNAGW